MLLCKRQSPLLSFVTDGEMSYICTIAHCCYMNAQYYKLNSYIHTYCDKVRKEKVNQENTFYDSHPHCQVDFITQSTQK